jgi:hypothetical protein
MLQCVVGEEEANNMKVLHSAALIALSIGAVASIVFMFQVGGGSVILLAVFAVWVLAPLAALFGAEMYAKGWSSRSRTTLDVVALIVAVASPLVYGSVALGPPRPQPAFYFMVVPAASWLLMVVSLTIAAVTSRSISSAQQR